MIIIEEDEPFPSAEEADSAGVVGIGASLSEDRLLEAYSKGIFPWSFTKVTKQAIWWSPDPRFVLFPNTVHFSRSMKHLLKKKAFRVTLDQDFDGVIRNCSEIPRKGQSGSSWITQEIIDAFGKLHEAGYVHSVEVWNHSGDLVGGVYGLSIGRMFCGESMFSKESNASKYGFLTLVQELCARDFELIDAQVYTPHLESLGGVFIPRKEFLDRIQKAQLKPTFQGKWSHWLRPLHGDLL